MQRQLIELLEGHDPFDGTETGHLEHALAFVRRTPACASRATPEGHVTASAWVLSPDLHATLLTHHRKLDRWLQPGGHVEDDATIQQAALREALEESGIDRLALVSDALFDIDVHLIPARKSEPAHYHYDFRFLIRAGHSLFAAGEESIDLAWVPLGDIIGGEADESVARMARKTADFLAAHRHGIQEA